MNYNDLSKEMQTFLNKAMDIYSAIKDRVIRRDVKYITKTINYEFSNMDKKVLALFSAAFLVDGNLRQIFLEQNDIKINDLFDFIGIKESDIIPILDGKYEEFFEKNFKLSFSTILREGIFKEFVNSITPEVTIYALKQFLLFKNFKILDFFKERYNIGGPSGIYNIPVFGMINTYVHENGNISDSPQRKTAKNDQNKNSSIFNYQHESTSAQSSPDAHQQSEKMLQVEDSVWKLLDDILKKFIGQEETAEGLFYNIINNQFLATMEETIDGQRSIIFMDGPSGTGKTAITREIAKQLNIPVSISSSTNYSATGYVGGNITETLEELYSKSKGKLEMAQRGVIVFDEFDKLATRGGIGSLEMKRAVQQQLLDFMGGGKYTLRSGIEFDTSRLTFVCLGALTDLRRSKTEKKQAIGFDFFPQSSEQQSYSITPQDLMGIGLEKELVGRFNTYLHTRDYSKEDLRKILEQSTISPLIGFKKWVESMGKTLKIDNEVYDLIVDYAYELNTGARSLQTAMNSIRTCFIKEVLRGSSKTIHLDSETVAKIYDQTKNRKGRG